MLRNVWKLFGARSAEAFAAIQRDGLTKSEVLDRFDCVVGVADASLEVRAGETFCIMGLSGSGKSTLVRHVNRLLEPTSGDIIVEGENILAKNATDLRALRARKIGMVFQHVGLLPHRTVRDNVALPLEIQGLSKRRRYDMAEETLALVDLRGWGDRLPRHLSGGMQQRVGLARALTANPDILLLDEPFSALDPLIRRQLQDQFIHLSRVIGKTAVFITHDLDEALRIGHRVAVMKDGRIIQIGTPEEIVTAPGDDYVADFVAHTSRLHVVHAATIMQPSDDLQTGADLPTTPAAATLGEVLELIGTASAITVTNSDGSQVGVISRERLLLGVRGAGRA